MSACMMAEPEVSRMWCRTTQSMTTHKGSNIAPRLFRSMRPLNEVYRKHTPTVATRMLTLDVVSIALPGRAIAILPFHRLHEQH